MRPEEFEARLRAFERRRNQWLVVAWCAVGLLAGVVWHWWTGGGR